MLWRMQKGVFRVEHNSGTVGSGAPGTSVTTGATSSTKGTPAEVFASTSFDAYFVTILAAGYAATTTDNQCCLDILTGASTEEVLIPNLLAGYVAGYTSNSSAPKRWDFPLYVPAGSRIAIQAAGSRTSTTFQAQIYLYGGNGYPPFRVGSKVTTYGIGTVPSGTVITPGGSAAEGSFVEITSATTEDHFALVPSLQPDGLTTVTNRMYAADIGIGAATEEEIAQGYIYRTTTNETMDGPINTMPTFQDIPSGTRLAMRVSCSHAIDGDLNAAIHAVS